jgi:hypothetical protein
MENKYEKMAEFIADVMTEERVKIARDNVRGKQKGEFTLEEFETLVSDIGRYTYSWDNKVPPFKVPLYESEYDSDHDHGAWTDRYVIDLDGRFYEVMFDYYGQGDFDGDQTKWNNATEVFKKEVTVTVYE